MVENIIKFFHLFLITALKIFNTILQKTNNFRNFRYKIIGKYLNFLQIKVKGQINHFIIMQEKIKSKEDKLFKMMGVIKIYIL
jgi:hypothetical protein